MLFDSHSHLTHPLFDGDREKIIKKLRDLNIKTISIGADLGESEGAIELSKNHPDLIWASAGIHPDGAKNGIENFLKLENLAADEKVVAIGECGLDYYRGRENQDLQKKLFIKQIELALKLNKPLIIHCRAGAGTTGAYEEAADIIENYKLQFKNYNNGVIHFFSGSKEIARKFLNLGFCISFAGPITFSDQCKETVKYVPLDKFLVETDSPFAAPVPYRGKRNEPAFVEFAARRIAEWKKLTIEEIARQTTENAKKLFNIDR